MALEKITVPDLGDSDSVEVIELLVSVGQEVSENDSLLVLESDKAAMELPASVSGIVKAINVNLGDQVSQGDEILTLEIAGDERASDASEEGSSGDSAEEKSEVEAPAEDALAKDAVNDSSQETAADKQERAEPQTSEQIIEVPDLGSGDEVEIIEVHMTAGDELSLDQPMVTLESDKAAMELPSPVTGTIIEVLAVVGDKVNVGAPLAKVRVVEEPLANKESSADKKPSADRQPSVDEKPSANKPSLLSTPPTAESNPSPQSAKNKPIYAGPAVRKLARELGVDLQRVTGSGAKGRIVKEDVQQFVKTRLSGAAGGAIAAVSQVPDIDFSQFGDIEEVSLSKLHKITAVNMHRSWSNVPHVAQFNEIDITDLEKFRADLKPEAEKKGTKITFMPFLLKACVKALQEYPQFNVSLHSSGEHLIQKKYFHIGVAVATEAGLLVPVIRDVDKKSIWQLSEELAELVTKAKARRLTKDDLQGACFSISSLGAIGGTGFIPIVNSPEVAILGVANTEIKPVYRDGDFVPRKMMPITLSYDHRAVNGVDGGLFATYLAKVLADIRHLVL